MSNQSEIIKSRDYLEEKFEELNNYYKTTKPQRPNNWGGYIVKPQLFEFQREKK